MLDRNILSPRCLSGRLNRTVPDSRSEGRTHLSATLLRWDPRLLRRRATNEDMVRPCVSHWQLFRLRLFLSLCGTVTSAACDTDLSLRVADCVPIRTFQRSVLPSSSGVSEPCFMGCTKLFRPFVTGSDESVRDHATGESASLPPFCCADCCRLRLRLHWTQNRHNTTVWTDSRYGSRNKKHYCLCQWLHWNRYDWNVISSDCLAFQCSRWHKRWCFLLLLPYLESVQTVVLCRFWLQCSRGLSQAVSSVADCCSCFMEWHCPSVIEFIVWLQASAAN